MRVGVVGAGTTGTLVSHLIRETFPKAQVTLFEQNSKLLKQSDDIVPLIPRVLKSIRANKLIPHFDAVEMDFPHVWDHDQNSFIMGGDSPIWKMQLTTKNTILESLMNNQNDYELKLDTRIASMGPAGETSVTTAEGDTHEFDYVILSDGYQSIGRKVVHHVQLPFREYAGFSNMKIDRPYEFHADLKHRFQAFPVEDITFFVGLLGEKQTQRDRKFEGFHPLMSWNNFKSSFDKDFPEFVQHILEHAEERSFYERPPHTPAKDPLKKFVSGNYILLGEACNRLGNIHCFKSNAQFEDTLTLIECLKNNNLEDFTKLRKNQNEIYRASAEEMVKHIMGKNRTGMDAYMPVSGIRKKWLEQYRGYIPEEEEEEKKTPWW